MFGRLHSQIDSLKKVISSLDLSLELDVTSE